MGARKKHAPRRGSLGLRPRKRAARLLPRVRSWPEVSSEEPLLLAFIGYKAGMTHALLVDDRPGSITSGKEIFAPLTIIETPPLIPLAIRVYKETLNSGLVTLTEAWIDPPRELEIERKVVTFSSGDFDKKLKLIEDNLDVISDVRVIVASQPKLVGGLSKKKPDLLEIKIGGGAGIEDRLEYAKKILGNPVPITEVFKPGQYVDVIGVTKGKGFQGVIKRFGVKELPRWHKHRKGSRRIGARSPGIGTLSEVPQPGQTGYHRRTEYNKRIVLMGSDGTEITPAGGFPGYGIVRSDYVALLGSVVGPRKRPLVLRHPVRPPSWIPESPPKITYLSLESKQ